ncbi:MAG TPA: hypothetical protein VKY86_01625 [Promicromonospora sp.]|jgi:hypothetical protein|nr:hypothetical protein [Promicromonospora sp.]
MSIPAALALTGALLMFVALIVAFVADNESWKRKSQRIAVVAWVAFVAAVLSLVSSIWLEVLS